MKIIRSKYIPFGRFKAINLLGILFVKKNARINNRLINHEEIHTEQMKELIYVLFYLLYTIEWVVRLAVYSIRFVGRFIRDSNRKINFHLAYKKISFEKEAHGNEGDMEYLDNRRVFTWLKYL